MDNLQFGDVILVSNRNSYAFFVWLGNLWTNIFRLNKSVKFTHVGIMYDDYNILEALPQGVIIRKFPYKKDYKAYRYKDLTRQKSYNMLKIIHRLKGESYSWGLIIVMTVLKLLRLEKLFKGISHKGSVCSVVVAKIFKTINYKFKRDQSVDLIDPMDIADCILIEDKRAWKKIV